MDESKKRWLIWVGLLVEKPVPRPKPEHKPGTRFDRSPTPKTNRRIRKLSLAFILGQPASPTRWAYYYENHRVRYNRRAALETNDSCPPHKEINMLEEVIKEFESILKEEQIMELINKSSTNIKAIYGTPSNAREGRNRYLAAERDAASIAMIHNQFYPAIFYILYKKVCEGF